MNIEQFISIDTNQTIMEEADTLMEEYEQQKIDQLNQRVEGAGSQQQGTPRDGLRVCSLFGLSSIRFEAGNGENDY